MHTTDPTYATWIVLGSIGPMLLGCVLAIVQGWRRKSQRTRDIELADDSITSNPNTLCTTCLNPVRQCYCFTSVPKHA